MITIIDYGLGNLSSLHNMLKKIGEDSIISYKEEDIEKADKLILPGVGAFDTGIRNLEKLNIINTLNKTVIKKKTPILCICLGMQIITQKSEEGILNGLGWIDAQTKRFNFNNLNNKLKIPHMGWNNINIIKNTKLLNYFNYDARFYFVHSYHVVCDNNKDIIATTNHGYDFTSIIKHNNIIGVQFHPEKSHKFGIQLFRNFVKFS